jgi:SAM-dependent methyltransferase
MNRTVRAVVKDALPPFVYRALARCVVRARMGLHLEERWGVRPSTWYDSYYESNEEYHRHYTESGYYFLWAVVADRLMRHGYERILDLGCGPGQFASLLRDKGGKAYCGLDFSGTATKLARLQCPEFEFMTADICADGVLESLDYDCCTAIESLEHLEDDIGVIRRLRPGVPFYGTVPNVAHVSHVRFFRKEEEVRERYEPYFSGFRVESFRANSNGRMLYLMEGRKL